MRSGRAAAQDISCAVERRGDASGAAAAAGAAATSLIPQTLEEMRGDAEGAATRDLLARRGQVSHLAAMRLHAQHRFYLGSCSLAKDTNLQCHQLVHPHHSSQIRDALLRCRRRLPGTSGGGVSARWTPSACRPSSTC